MICLLGIAGDARANDVFPCRRSSAVFWDDMIQIEIPSLKHGSAILAGVLVSFKNVVPGEFNLLLRQSVKEAEQNDARNPDSE